MTQSHADHNETQAVEQITEQFHDWRASEIVIDETARLIRNVALAGTESRNGYRYSEEALRSAVPLYLNKPVFLDHAQNLSRPLDRSARDLVGSIVEPRFEAGRIRGDIQVVDTEAGRIFLALASANAPSVGMSHVVLVRKNSQGDVVEQIQDVVSVDAVAFPATTTSLRENQHEPEGASSASELTAETILEWRETLEEIVRRWPAIERMLGVDAESVPAVSPLTESSSADEAGVMRLLATTGLPEFAITECFRQCLLATADAAQRRQLCIDRLRLIDETRRLHPTSRERMRPSSSGDEHQILATFRRHPASVLAGYG